jgi:hypothetical protein
LARPKRLDGQRVYPGTGIVHVTVVGFDQRHRVISAAGWHASPDGLRRLLTAPLGRRRVRLRQHRCEVPSCSTTMAKEFAQRSIVTVNFIAAIRLVGALRPTGRRRSMFHTDRKEAN